MSKKNTRKPKSVYSVGKDPDVRASLANERTALAMIRTALALVATGLAMAALKSYLGINSAISFVAILLSAAGALTGIIAIFRWSEVEKAMRLNKPIPNPEILVPLAVTIFIAGIVTIIGVLI
jgi:putative membrane protein